MKRIIFRFSILLLIALCTVLICKNAMAGGVLTNMRYWSAPDHTRIVFDLTEPPVYTTARQDDNHLIITFRETTCAESVPREIRINKAGIGELTLVTLKEGDVLVRLELGGDTETNVFPLKKFQDKPDRLVIDVELPEVSKQESRMREQIKVSKTKKIIIIDPGHGGDDPGAIGKRGTYEKDVVLAIGQRLKKALDRHGFYQAYLTRNGDYYVPFNKRLQIAREYGADLFISIHADAAKNRDARGSSVYCLSTGGAGSVAAKILAQNENLADIVGGVQEEDMKDDTNPILINMCQTNTINVSKAFGLSVLWELSSVGELKFDKIQEAPLRVLKMPEIPAVLIETAYISNPEEEKLLDSAPFQKKIADSIARTVVRFFDAGLPVKETEPTVKESGKDGTASGHPLDKKPIINPFFLYTVGKGDTLTAISRKFGVPVTTIVAMNGMKVDDPLYVGKHLKIEGEEREQQGPALIKEGGDNVSVQSGLKKPEARLPGGEAKKPFFIYTVVKGDTLSRITTRFNVSLQNLLAINKLKPDAPLYVGRRLKIEGTQPESVNAAKKEGTTDKPKEKAPRLPRTYRVREGDTLLDIARKQGVPVEVLLKLNNMKLDDALIQGRLLILGDRGKEK